MKKSIIRDTFFLSQPSSPATSADLETVSDLYDTLDSHRDDCVGMAANMIGVSRRIIAVRDGDDILVMLNPEIMKAAGPYKTSEGCLSLDGQRETTRYRSIKVKWQDGLFRPKIRTFTGYTAQIIQHEIDHINGVLI